MTTVELIGRAKDELELALNQKLITKGMDTPEYQAAQIGKAFALLEVALDQATADADAFKDALQVLDHAMIPEISMNGMTDEEREIFMEKVKNCHMEVVRK